MRRLTSILFLAACLALVVHAANTTIIGKVTKIADGDTITVLVERRQVKIRLAEIDTPERRQPWGNKAKQALAAKVFGKTVTVRVVDVDRYGSAAA